MWLGSSRVWTQKSWHISLAALWHMESFRTKEWTHVPCVSRQILTHCTTRQVPVCVFILSYISCFYILQINPLSVALFANIFSHSVGCLFFYGWKKNVFLTVMGRVQGGYGRHEHFQKVNREGDSGHLCWDIHEKDQTHKNPRGTEDNYDADCTTKCYHPLTLMQSECKAVV